MTSFCHTLFLLSLSGSTPRQTLFVKVSQIQTSTKGNGYHTDRQQQRSLALTSILKYHLRLSQTVGYGILCGIQRVAYCVQRVLDCLDYRLLEATGALSRIIR